jgi:tyrosyl-tRNA synthetase
MLKRVGVPLERLRFVRGTSYQLKENYTLDVYKLAALSTTVQAQHAGAEVLCVVLVRSFLFLLICEKKKVVKQSAAPKLSNLMYPLLQALDEEYLGVDVQFGGVDQRKIFMYAREWLPKIGYKKRAYVMNPLIPGLGKSGKMSSSEKQSKVDLHDSAEAIRDKILKAYSIDGKPEGNGLLALLRHVLFRFLDGKPLICGGRSFATYDAVLAAFCDGSLPSLPLKEAVATLLTEFLEPLRAFWEKNK